MLQRYTCTFAVYREAERQRQNSVSGQARALPWL
jgi:hypothetical protein